MILTVTLNASIDKTYRIEGEIIEGSVSRVLSCTNTAGGKGLNVSRVAKQCGGNVLATGLVGGYNGEYLCSLLNHDDVKHSFVTTINETRSCINIISEKNLSSTEFLEPGCEVSNKEITDFINHYRKLLPACQVVTLSGSIPKGIPRYIYKELITIAKQLNKIVILDTSNDLLVEGIKAKPTMIKPNREELEAILGCEITSYNQIIEKASELQKQGIKYVIVSLGKDGALGICDAGVFQAKPPKIEAVNTVGCGDSMVAAFAVALEKKLSITEALQFAVAVSASNALTPTTGNILMTDVNRILKQTQVVKVK